MRTASAQTTRGRVLLMGIIASLSMLGPFAIDTVFPAFADISRELGVDRMRCRAWWPAPA